MWFSRTEIDSDKITVLPSSLPGQKKCLTHYATERVVVYVCSSVIKTLNV